MSVEEVHVPGRTTIKDPKHLPEKGTTESYYEKQTKEARARREFLEEQQLISRVTDPPPAAEPIFKVTGGVNLGNIDLQAERAEALRVSGEERKRQEEKVTALEQQAGELRETLHKTQLDQISNNLTKQIEELRRSLTSGSAPQKSLADQIAEIRQLASALGLKDQPAVSSDATLSLELKRLDISLQRESQAFEVKKTMDDRNYQLELRKLDILAAQTNNQLDVERQKLALWTAMPQQIGGVLAKAVIDGTRDKIGKGSSVTPDPGAKQDISGHVTAGIGEAGEIDCPNPECGKPIAIGPTARIAECAICHVRIRVERTKKPAPPAETREPIAVTEGEEE